MHTGSIYLMPDSYAAHQVLWNEQLSSSQCLSPVALILYWYMYQYMYVYFTDLLSNVQEIIIHKRIIYLFIYLFLLHVHNNCILELTSSFNVQQGAAVVNYLL